MLVLDLFIHKNSGPAIAVSRDFERKDSRDEASRALSDLKAKGMKINQLPASESARRHDKLTAVRPDRDQRRHGPLERDQDGARENAQVVASGGRPEERGRVA